MHYRYTAADAKGKRVRGALNANDQSDVITQLQDMGCLLYTSRCV